MRDYSMDLAKIAANIVTDVMGTGLTAETKYSSDGNNIIMEFNGYPLRGSKKRAKSLFSFLALPSMYVREMSTLLPSNRRSAAIIRRKLANNLHILMCTTTGILAGITANENVLRTSFPIL